jgi:phosphohistidine phosphatase
VTDRRLLVMRHAKAEPFAASDHARALTDRGAATAREVGSHLASRGVLPERAVVSSSVRTRQTWDAVVETAGLADVPVSYDDAVFGGNVEQVLDALRAAPEGTGTLMLVGHNPAAAFLCHYLDDGEGDPASVSELLRGFPPAAVALLDVHVPWAELGEETASVVGFHVGQG